MSTTQQSNGSPRTQIPARRRTRKLSITTGRGFLSIEMDIYVGPITEYDRVNSFHIPAPERVARGVGDLQEGGRDD